MLRIRLKADLRCPTHKRFTGEDKGAVKQGCFPCQDLCNVAAQVRRLNGLIAIAESSITAAEQFAKAKAGRVPG